MNHERFANKIPQLSKHSTFPEFWSKRQALAWLTHTRPDIPAPVNLAAQVIESKFSRKEISALNQVIRRVHSSARGG